jgi:hypothetical protein
MSFISPQRRREVEEILAICDRAVRLNEERGADYKISPGLAGEVIRDLLRERDSLRSALRKLMLSRDASWTGGRDWDEALNSAVEALGIAQ